MLKKFIILIILSVCSLLFVSCSNSVKENQVSSNFETSTIKPSEVNIKSTLIFDIPDATASHFKIPSKLNGDLQIKVISEVISNKPVRSHFSVNICIVFSDTITNQSYLDFKTTIEGDADGSPSEGITEAFKRIMNVIKLLLDSSDNFIQQNSKD